MVHCSVPGCHISGGKKKFSKDIKIHPLPANEHRARLWIKAIPRDWKCSDIKRKSIAVCSLHFIGRIKSDDPTAPNYVPTVFPHKTTETKARKTKNSTNRRPLSTSPSTDQNTSDCNVLEHYVSGTKRESVADHTYQIKKKSKVQAKHCNSHNTSSNNSQSITSQKALQEHDYLSFTTHEKDPSKSDLLQHIDDLQKKMKKLELKAQEAEKKVVNIETIESRDECRQWTGLASFAVFEQLLSLIMTSVWSNSTRWCGQSLTGQKGHVRCLTPPMQLLLTLIRLKTGNPVFAMSKMFGVSDGLVSEIFTTWIGMLHVVLKKLFHLPPKHKVKENPAPCYRQWNNLVTVLDCTELFIESPKKMQANKEVFSNYKQHDTAKFLVGNSPNMCVIYVSDGWCGRASDKTITLSSDDLLEWLQPGDTVMSDKGFLIGHELAGRNIKLLIPPFKGSDRSQFTNVEIEQSENVSKARVHIERLIGRIKSYEILQGVIKLSMLDILPQVFGVCSYLVNLQTTTVRY